MGFLYAAADLSGLVDPAKPETFPGCYAAFMADAVGTFVGGFLGTSSVTTYGESMAGVYEGGRTGLTALVIAFLNFICIFLTPLLSSIPTLSTGPALVMVGVFMIEGVKDIDWTDYMQAIPSTICILLQITTYKIEVGVLGALFVRLAWISRVAQASDVKACPGSGREGVSCWCCVVERWALCQKHFSTSFLKAGDKVGFSDDLLWSRLLVHSRTLGATAKLQS